MGRNKQLDQKIKDERREQILSAALMLFATNGLAATKIADIAAASDMSLGLFYHYFGCKEDVFVELIRGAFERMNTAVLELEKLPLSPREKIRLALEKLLQGLDENPATGHYHLLIAMASASNAIPAQAQAIIQKENQVPYQVMARIMAQGQQDGSIRNYPANELALVFWTSIKGLCIHKAAQGKNFKAPHADILMNMFI